MNPKLTPKLRSQFIQIGKKQHVIDTDEQKLAVVQIMRKAGIEGGRICQEWTDGETIETIVTEEFLFVPESEFAPRRQ